jgi:hypothetical protein
MIKIAQLPINDPHTWTKEELYTNLQAAVDVELWTIPLYLTALYSIKDLNSNNQGDYPVVAKLIESVVIEEMLHLQLACNICNALGYSPKINMPVYSEAEGIPFIKASAPEKYQGYHVQLGGLDINQLKLFCTIELPEPKTNPDWSQQTEYNSIGELYQALEIAITNLWSELYVSESNSKQIAFFEDYSSKYNTNPSEGFSQKVRDLDTALAAMQAIVGQGEGNTSNEIPDPDQPPASKTDPGDFDPAESHFLKFNEVLDQLTNNTDIPDVYPVIADPDPEQLIQQTAAMTALQDQFKIVINDIQTGFNVGDLPTTFWDDMTGMQARIAAVWQSGAVPIFATSSAEHQS